MAAGGVTAGKKSKGQVKARRRSMNVFKPVQWAERADGPKRLHCSATRVFQTRLHWAGRPAGCVRAKLHFEGASAGWLVVLDVLWYSPQVVYCFGGFMPCFGCLGWECRLACCFGRFMVFTTGWLVVSDVLWYLPQQLLASRDRSIHPSINPACRPDPPSRRGTRGGGEMKAVGVRERLDGLLTAQLNPKAFTTKRCITRTAPFHARA